jgi:MoxR-like ATPase
VDPSIISYAVRLVSATRDPARYELPELKSLITYGASPRATISMIEGAKALAMMRGRRYVLPEDVSDLVPDVMRHRLVLSYEALAEGRSADDIIRAVMAKVPVPDKPLQHVEGEAGAEVSAG